MLQSSESPRRCPNPVTHSLICLYADAIYKTLCTIRQHITNFQRTAAKSSAFCHKSYKFTSTIRKNKSSGTIIMQPSRPALGPNQPAIQWVPGLFSRVKRPGRAVNHPPPSSARVKERVELYLYFPSGSSWPVLGRTLHLPFLCKHGMILCINLINTKEFNKHKAHILLSASTITSRSSDVQILHVLQLLRASGRLIIYRFFKPIYFLNFSA
jgi:hypothetical protein